MPILLDAKQVTKKFGGLIAVDKVDFVIEKGMIASLIGPNGAGKTTFFNCITGFYRADEGSILFDGGELGGCARTKSPHTVSPVPFRTSACFQI
jgi:branched-chain amino acid transport system ATP-binding protein